MGDFAVIGLYILYLLTWIIAGVLIGRDEQSELDYSRSLPTSAKVTLCFGFVLAVLIAVYSEAFWAIKLAVALLGGLVCYIAWAVSRRTAFNS